MDAAEWWLESKKRELGVALNEVQTQAVLHGNGPLLLLASPGSGKTTTIIMRIGYLIQVKGVNPSRIKAVTFSNASASDMKMRYGRFFPDLPPVDFSTIHSLAYRVMREHFHRTRTEYQIIEGELETEETGGLEQGQPPLHKKIILRELYQTLTGEKLTDDQLDELTTYISYIKNKMLPEGRWGQVRCDVPQAERILREYETFKRTGHSKLLIDFDDMLTMANEVMESNKELRRRYQQSYDYVLTDESQDTSMIQHAIIGLLVRRHHNLCVVADDDQSIYSWRGAEPSYLLDFKKEYPNAVTLFMEQNYRSTRDIVEAANLFIKRNKNRYDKNMFTANPPGSPVCIKTLTDYKAQAKYLVKEITGVENLGEIAVLYRNNSSSIVLMNELDRAGIPFYMKDSDNRFFKHWVVEDILNFMRMTFTDKRPDLLEKIHLKLNAYITKHQMAELKKIPNQDSVFDNLLRYVGLQEYQVKLVEECRDTFRQMNGMPPLHAIRTIRGKLGYDKALDKICERLGFRKEYLAGILNTLEGIADTLGSMEEFALRLKHLEAALRTSKRKKGHNAVTLSTFHSSKGLEFERVYMVDLVQGILPSPEDLRGSPERKTELMEEAGRLFYVGMTRAKSRLELITYNKRDGEKTEESRFVTELRAILQPPKRQNPDSAAGKKTTAHSAGRGKSSVPNPNAVTDRSVLLKGAAVRHRVFGSGTVLQVNGDKIKIRFTTGEKALALDICLEMGLLELSGA